MHIASVLFYIEAWNRVNEKLSCTQVECSWLMPTAVKKVPYAPVSDIDFRSAKKLKQNLDQTIDGLTTSEGIARSGEAVKIIPVSDKPDLSNFEGCGEVKCPYCLKDIDLKDYPEKSNSCWKSEKGATSLKREHAYYYQSPQQLLFTTGYHYLCY